MRVELSVLQSERMKLHAMARTATARLDALVAKRETGEDGTSTDAGAVAVRDARATAAAFAADASAARDRAATAETAAREALRARDDALRELEIDRAARSSDASDRRAAFARVVADETKAETESGTFARLREALAEVECERERDRIERAADADLRVELEHINASLVEEAMKCTEIEKKMRAEIKRTRRELRDARAARDDALRLAAGAEDVSSTVGGLRADLAEARATCEKLRAGAGDTARAMEALGTVRSALSEMSALERELEDGRSASTAFADEWRDAVDALRREWRTGADGMRTDAKALETAMASELEASRRRHLEATRDRDRARSDAEDASREVARLTTLLDEVRSILHWSPYDRVRVVNAVS